MTREEIREAAEALVADWPDPAPGLLADLAVLLRPVRRAA